MGANNADFHGVKIVYHGIKTITPQSENQTYDKIPLHLITAEHPTDGTIGTLAWHPKGSKWREPGYIDDIETTRAHQRKGVATAMYRHAEKIAATGEAPYPKHSDRRTPDGDAWAKKVGGSLPTNRFDYDEEYD